MANRTNFVKVSNIPPGYSNGQELFSVFSSCGNVQDMTAVDATTIIVSYGMRSSAEYAAFALNGMAIGGKSVRVELHFLHDPTYTSLPQYSVLGQYIGQDHHVMNPNNFQPWGSSQISSQTSSSSFHQNPLASSYIPHSSSASHQNHFAGSNIPINLPPSYSLGPNFVQNMMSYISAPGPSNVPSATTVTPNAKKDDVDPKELVARYTTPFAPQRNRKDQEDHQCSICLGDLFDSSGYSDNSSSTSSPALSLVQCKHAFHEECLVALINNNPSPFLQCPTCKKVHGIMTGTMPTNGTMTHRLCSRSVPGYENCGSIEIHFQFPSTGIQGQEHPNPGQRYTAMNFPRTAYLPNNQEGVQALHGLYIAWEQRLMFTVGRSITNGRDNCVTWNDIHLKTHLGGGEHSYPDAHHLKNLFEELAGFGISEAEILAHMRKYPNLKVKGHL